MGTKLYTIGIVLLLLIQDSHQTRRIRDVSGGSLQSNGRIGNFALKALGSFKSFMKEGNRDLGIPTLDPVQLEGFNYALDNKPVGFRMEIVFESPSLTGLSNYELSGANELISAEGTVLQMTIVFPTVQIKGFYKANGNLFGFFNLGGQGDFEIVGISQVLATEVKVKAFNQSVSVDSISSQFVGGRVKSQFNDKTNSTPFLGLVGEFLSAMGTHVFDSKLKPVITTAMNGYMKDWLNGAFSSVSLNEILGTQTQHQVVQPENIQEKLQFYPQNQQQQQPQFHFQNQ